MKTKINALVLVAGLFCAATGFAQTAATATTAATTAATNAVNNAKASTAAAMAPAPKASAPAAAPVAAAPMAKADPKMAAGGGAGKVWVNSGSKTYHCEGSKFYGKTKAGEFMTETDAKAKGNKAVKGKACAK